MINFFNINYINYVVLKRMKFLTLRYFWNEKSENEKSEEYIKN